MSTHSGSPHSGSPHSGRPPAGAARSGSAGTGEPAGGTMLGAGRTALDLQRLLGEDPDRTVAWSPLSVGSALGLVWAGAAGRTAVELAAALEPEDAGAVDDVGQAGDTGHPGNASGAEATRAAGLAAIAREATQGPVAGAELLAANVLWADRALPVAQGFTDVVADWPGGSVRAVDFAGAPDAARSAVNDGVREATNGLIPQLLGPSDVGADTLAVLVSAFWLRLRWEQPFDASQTKPETFRAPAGKRRVPTMRDVRQVPYARAERAGGGWSMVSLSGQDVMCDVLLPDHPHQEPDAGLLADLRSDVTPTMVDLRLPRVRVQSRFGLTEPLGRLGVRRVFTDAAELPGVAPVPLRLDAVVHEAVLGIDETGAEAAAATAASMVLAASVGRPPEPVRFHVDRPFLVLLRHRQTGAAYLLARVSDP